MGDTFKSLIANAPSFQEFKVDHFIHKDLIHKVRLELRNRGISVPLRFYVSTEWFCEDQTTAIAIPFYLCHPTYSFELAKAGVQLEGYDPNEALKIIRHEIGHAIDHALQLRKSKQRQNLFGLSSTPYPQYYWAKDSSDFVEHLSDHYAQSHPDEDWAETFAYWLANRLHPSLERSEKIKAKLKLVSTLIDRSKTRPIKLQNRPFLDPLSSDQQVYETLEQILFAQKQKDFDRPRSQILADHLLSKRMKKKMEAGYRIYSM